MDKEYWLSRKRAAGEMARKAVSAEARLIHFDLAGRYSVQAATCPAMIAVPRAEPAFESPAALRLLK